MSVGYGFDVKWPFQYAATRESCGRLKWDEMYNYAPALALGGTPKPQK